MPETPAAAPLTPDAEFERLLAERDRAFSAMTHARSWTDEQKKLDDHLVAASALREYVGLLKELAIDASRQHNGARDQRDIAEKQLAEARAENARLQSALANYGAHTPLCENDDNDACNCGYFAALREDAAREAGR